ncbi:MAG: hypothetical protein ACC618_01550 [Patescibacteria group bacterium]
MKIFVIHGDYTIKSYERLHEIINSSKKKGWVIERISAKDSLSLPERLTAKSLFENKNLYVVNELNSLTKADFEWLKKKSDGLEGHLVLYSGGTVGKRALNFLAKGYKVEEYKLPKLIWKFLESFYPGNAKNSLELLHEVIKNEAPEFVFALLARQMRDVYWVSLEAKSVPYPSWRVGKLRGQAKKFKNGQLEKIIKELAEADIKAKTSKTSLQDSLDFLIATHLE